MNLIFIVLDTLRADHMGCYGNAWIKTPRFDEFAQESAVFDRCYPESLPTVPARRAIVTGNRMYPFRDWQPVPGDNVTTPGWAPLRDTDITVSEILLNAGYRTAFFTDVLHFFKPSMNFHRGFDEWRWIRGQEYDRYRSAPVPKDIDIDHYLTPNLYGTYAEAKTIRHLSCNAWRKKEADWSAPLVFQEGMRWLEENHEDSEKFYLYIDAYDPHEPWDPPKEYSEMYDPGYNGKEVIVCKPGNPNDYLNQAELKHMKACYAGEVTMIDKWFGKLVDKVNELGLDKNTVIIVTSDHGTPLGEHNIIHKIPLAMYPTLMDIPLMIRHPEGIGAGKRFDDIVYHHDLFMTLLNFADVEPPDPVDSQDIWSIVTGKGGFNRNFATCSFGRYIWLRDDNYVYIAETDGSDPQLFDLQTDPDHFINIAADHPGVCKEMLQKAEADAGGQLPDFSYLAAYPASSSFRTGLDHRKK